ncbi:helix-turn-helix transcriptional regulator [Tropicimonas aquimaris]|uniref:Helix-turn-helix transcriptional regulator n=1 Tax=Tropicimonas aquimaris TaxID=914152 RepID=A0ABW3IXI3_9RHOB
MPQFILRRPDVESRTGLSRSTIYAKMDPRSPHHDPEFPKPVRLGKRAVGWRESDIIDWMNSRESTTA